MPTSLAGPSAPLRAGVAAAALCAAPLLPLAAFAQSSATPSDAAPDTVVVTASRSPQRLADVLADVTVIDRATIERSGASSLADVLAGVPGVAFARNGGPGTTTSVFIRGSESRHTAVYLDGVRLDGQSTGGAPWEQIPLAQIERIEVLRGPGAAVHGSNAIGGVVQLFTRKGRTGVHPSAALSVGSHRTVQADAALAGGTAALDYALSLSHGRSDGFNAKTDAAANPDADGWRRSAAHGRVGVDLAPGHRLDATVLASGLRAQYDGSRSNDDVSRQTLRSAALAWSGRWSDGSSSRAQLDESRNTYETQPDFYRTETTLRDYSFQHEATLAGQHLSATLERREDRLLNPATAWTPVLAGDRAQDALALGWRTELGAHALQAHWRHDRDSEFGGKGTGSVAWGWRFAPQWRVTASAATSFRAPTLYQRFSEYGVATLTPESGRNAELGLAWRAPAPGGGSELTLTAWRNTVRQLIVFGDAGRCASDWGCYANVGRARYEGATLAARHRVADIALHGSLDWHDPRNLDTDKQLRRRASRLATFGAATTWAGWSLGLDLRASGARFDDDANRQRLGGYGVVDVRVGRPLAPGLTLEARVDNVGAKAYVLARGYATEGRSATVGLRWAMP